MKLNYYIILYSIILSMHSYSLSKLLIVLAVITLLIAVLFGVWITGMASECDG